ncbi:hypothetical protein [Paenibacillus sp. RC84]|uniref:hypothetical protein n=1 Tax=Paenibacillus sp. RC84 TaxID=3156252 RepID=UPI003511181A
MNQAMVSSSMETYLAQIKDEEIIWIGDRAFVIMPATETDIERIGKGYFVMD